MPLQLYDLPFDMLEMIGQRYDDLAQRDSTATLQAALKRHVVTRCDNPRHYQYCHNHPRGVKCWATRTEYFDRILAQHGRKDRGRAWA